MTVMLLTKLFKLWNCISFLLILFAVSLSELKKYLTNSRLYLCCIYYWMVIKKGSSSSGVGRCTKCLRRISKLGLIIIIQVVVGSRRYKRVTLTAGGWFSSNYLLLVWIQSGWLLSHCTIKFNNGGQYWTELNVITTYGRQLSGKGTIIRAQWESQVFCSEKSVRTLPGFEPSHCVT